MKIWDISPLISSKTAVFPGDTPFSQKTLMSFKNKDHLHLSTIESTVHIGAHTDAPSHYNPKGKSIDKITLEPYIGPAQVIEVHCGNSPVIEPEHFHHVNIATKRVLFKTSSFKDSDSWSDDFKAISVNSIKALAKKGVKLVGIDTPSVDPSTSKSLDAHHEVYKNDLRILEGINLEEVNEGNYNLIALPLKLKNLDASPVRAVLTRP